MFAMHMQHALRPGPLVQIVHILRHDQQLTLSVLGPFGIEPGQSMVRRVGLLGLDRRAAQVVETQDEVGIARERLGSGDIFDPMLLP